MAEIHSRQSFVRQISEMPDETKVQIYLRNSRQSAGDTIAPLGGAGGDIFSFVGEKSDNYEIGQECTISITKE